jgi:DNA-binding protein HU-beta
MTKAELIGQVADSAGLSKKDAEAAIDATFDSITELLANRDKIQLSGFGTFTTKERAERTSVNPATGKKMQVPASTVAVFKAGKGLKDRVNK